MIVSSYAKHLAACFGTVQAAPIAVGARGNSSELVSFGGRMLPSISPTQLKQLLTGARGDALTAKGALRDLRRNFEPISKIGFGTVVMVVPPSLGVSSVKELIALAKAKPGQLSFASSGIGGLIHLTGELFKQMAGVDILHVPYKGTTQLLPDLIDGRVSMAIDSLPAHIPHIKAGRLRALGVARKTRSAQLPDVPTLSEAGVPGFESYTDYALYAPAGTSKAIVLLLNRETIAVLQLSDLRAKLDGIGIEVSGSTPEALRTEVVSEVAKWTKVIKDANIKQE